MTYAMVHQPGSNNAQSPFRVIVQKTGRPMGNLDEEAAGAQEAVSRANDAVARLEAAFSSSVTK